MGCKLGAKFMIESTEFLPRSSKILLQRLVYYWLPNIREYMPTYGDINPMDPRQIPGLEKLALWLKASNLPPITAIIVLKATRKPGPDFFNMFYSSESGQNKNIFWKEAVSQSTKFDWTTFVEAPEKFTL